VKVHHSFVNNSCHSFSAFRLVLLLNQPDLQGEAQAWTQGLCLSACGLLWQEHVGDSGAWLHRTSQDQFALR